MTTPSDNVATRALFHLRGDWSAGGDMGHPRGFLVQEGSAFYAVKLELWTEDCLMDLKRGGRNAARRRGEALAKRWSKEHWPHVGYLDLEGAEGVFGATWAFDKASEREIEQATEDDLLILPRQNPIVPPNTVRFRSWFSGSFVVDERGKPLVVFRGEHGEDTSKLLRSRMESKSLSFTDSAALAGHFAMNRYREGETPVPRIVPVYLQIKNPVITDEDLEEGSFLPFDVVVEKIGRTAARKALRSFYPPGTKITRDLEMSFPAFFYLNDPAFVKEAARRGYDGAIFTADYRGIEGMTGSKDLGIGEVTEYRTFSRHQAWPALLERRV